MIRIQYTVTLSGGEYTHCGHAVELDTLLRDLAKRGVDLTRVTVAVKAVAPGEPILGLGIYQQHLTAEETDRELVETKPEQSEPAPKPCVAFLSPWPPWYGAQCKLPRGHAGECEFGTQEEAKARWEASMEASRKRLLASLAQPS